MGRLFKKRAPVAHADGWDDGPEEKPYNREATLLEARKSLADGKFDAAEASYKTVLSDNNADIEGLRGLAETFQRKGFRQQAIMTYNRLLAVDANDAEAKRKLSEIMKSG